MWAWVASCSGAKAASATSWGQEYKGQHQLDSQLHNRSNSPQGTQQGQNWAPEGRLQPIAHSSPAYGQGPAAYCKKGANSATDAAVGEYPTGEANGSTGWGWSVDDGSEGGVTANEGEYQLPGGYYATH